MKKGRKLGFIGNGAGNSISSSSCYGFVGNGVNVYDWIMNQYKWYNEYFGYK